MSTQKNTADFLTEPQATTTHFSLTSLLISVFPVVFLLILFCIRSFSMEFYRELVSEDGLLETLQFVFYFLTGCVLLNYVRMLLKKPGQRLLKSIVFLLSGAFIFMSFEEISWGERMLQYRRPDFFTDRNVQHEVSLHNMAFVQPYLHTLYIVVGMTLGLLVPLLSRAPRLKKFWPYLYGWELALYFIPLALVYLALEAAPPVSISGFSTYGFIWRDQEVVETLLAMGLFIWAIRLKGSIRELS